MTHGLSQRLLRQPYEYYAAGEPLSLKRPTQIALFGLALAAVKLAFLPIQAASTLSDLSDFGLTLLLGVTAWRASRRSQAFARALWLSVVFFSALEAANFGIGALAYALTSPEKALAVFWPTTIIFYVISIAFIVPLLLREDLETLALGGMQTLDMLQLGILTLAAYLTFFYIPSISGLSDALREHKFMILHVMRNGFLAAGFAYRAWRSASSELRQLQLRISIFFVAFGTTASLYLRALTIWHWPQPLLGFVADLPVVFLLWTAASWKQRRESPPGRMPLRLQGRLWARLFPLAVPFSVIGLASRIAASHPRVAWSAVTSSFLCYAGRLFLMQRDQDAVLSTLSVTEQKFSKAFHSSPIAIAINRLSDGKYLDANDRYLELMKMGRDEVIGRTTLELGIFGDVEERNMLVKTLRKEGSFRSLPFRFRTASRTLDTLVSAEVIKLEEESLIISSVLDISELKSVTQQLQQAQKMELVGTLAGGVAHDFNNLLTIIKGYCELASRPGGGVVEAIRHIEEAADRAAALTRQLLAFSRRQVLQPRDIVLNSVVSGIEKLLRRTIGENIELFSLLAPDLGTVHVDPIQIEQVVVNLAVNARDAMPNGGKLVFQTKNLELSSPFAESGFEIPTGRYVVLTATDTGTGIAREHLDRVFEPFFTTKEVGQGTGLGLSTVYGIVKQSGGYISVYSEVGLGASFKIYFPTVDRPAQTFTPREAPTHIPGGTETILVAEDDPRICELAAKVLKERGYKLITANSGEEALHLASELEGAIHLLLTDVVMAGISGLELARRLKEARPGLRVLFMSGYPGFSDSGANVMDLGQAILCKPFTPSELVLETRRALDRENYSAPAERR